jgi:hypothetical protein
MQPEVLKPWERQDNESDQAFEAFEIYRLQGQIRSIAKAAQTLGKSTTLLEGWSTKHGWRLRVLAYDRTEARILNEKIILGRADMRSRLINQSQVMQLRAATRVANMTETEINAMPMTQVVALFRAATDAEVKARAIPDVEMEGAERDTAPTFVIQVLRGADEGQIGVRLPDGTAGYIAATELERFKTDYPEAVVLI